ncbi:MAG: glycogen-binding domain-containing protein [Gemmatimonadota bacterium]
MKRARQLALTALFLLAGSTLSAQQWNLDAQAGRIRSALDPNAPETQTVVLGLRYDDMLSGLRFAAGVPTVSDEPLWGSLAGSKRLVARRGGFMAGVDLAGNAFLLHDRVQRTREVPGRGVFDPPTIEPLPSESGTAFAAQGLPLIGFENGSIQAHVRAGVSQYSAKFGEQNRQRRVQLADVQLMFTPTMSFAIMPALRHYRADEGNYTYAGATAITALGAASVWGSAGQWSNPTGGETAWAAGGSLQLHERATVNASVRREALDPLYLSPPQNAWSAGVTVLLGGKRTLAAPIPARYENGQATIRLPVSQARQQPRIAGDFNDWKPVPMQRAGSNWTYTIPLAPGVYNYAFVDESGEWFVPEKHAGRKDDGMGGHVAVLVVQK